MKMRKERNSPAMTVEMARGAGKTEGNECAVQTKIAYTQSILSFIYQETSLP
jgi:hypothetical protein